jgi:hypothetical protein
LAEPCLVHPTADSAINAYLMVSLAALIWQQRGAVVAGSLQSWFLAMPHGNGVILLQNFGLMPSSAVSLSSDCHTDQT